MTCPDFQTTGEFLPVHRQQAQLTQELLNAAEAAGRQRQAQNHRTVLINLDKIITSLQAADSPAAAAARSTRSAGRRPRGPTGVTR